MDLPNTAFGAAGGSPAFASPNNLSERSAVQITPQGRGLLVSFRACFAVVPGMHVGKLWQRWSNERTGDWFFLFAAARPTVRDGFDVLHHTGVRGMTLLFPRVRANRTYRAAGGPTGGSETTLFVDRAGAAPVARVSSVRVDLPAPAVDPLAALRPAAPCVSLARGRQLEPVGFTTTLAWDPDGSVWQAAPVRLSQAVESLPTDREPVFYDPWAPLVDPPVPLFAQTPAGERLIADARAALSAELGRYSRQVALIVLAALATLWAVHRFLGTSVQHVAAAVPCLLADARRAMVGLRADGPAHVAALGVICLLAVLFRLVHIGVPLRADEAYTFFQYAVQPLAVALSKYNAPNNHVLNTLLVHFSIGLFGEAEWAVRLPAFLAGSAVVPAVYAVGRVFFDRDVGLFAAATVGASSILIEYSTNARGYTLVALLFLVLLVLAAYLAARSNAAAWLLFALTGALGLYAVPIFLYPLGLSLLWLLGMAVHRPPPGGLRLQVVRMGVCLVAMVALTFALYSPVLVATGASGLAGNWFVQSRSWTFVLEHYRGLSPQIWQQWIRDVPPVVELCLVLGLVVAVVRLERPRRLPMPLLPAIGTVLAYSIVVQRAGPPARVWLFLLPLFFVLSFSALVPILRKVAARAPGPRAVAVPLCAVALCGGLGLNTIANNSVYRSLEDGTMNDAEAMALFLAEHAGPRDRVLAMFPGEFILMYYLRRHDQPVDMLYAPIERAPRAFIIASIPFEVTPQTVLEYWSFYHDDWLKQHRLLRSYPSAEIWEAVRAPG